MEQLPRDTPLREFGQTRDLPQEERRDVTTTWKILWHVPDEEPFSNGRDLENIKRGDTTIGKYLKRFARDNPEAMIDAVVRQSMLDSRSLDPDPVTRFLKSVYRGRLDDAFEIFVTTSGDKEKISTRGGRISF